MRSLLILLLVLSLLVGCKPEEAPQTGAQPPRWEPTGFLYAVDLTNAVVDGEESPAVGACAQVSDFVRFCAQPYRDGLRTQIVNSGSASVEVLWAESLWIDETGVGHEIILDEYGGNQSHLIGPGQDYRKVVFPRGKMYMVTSGRTAYLHGEPLIPWDQRSRHPDDTRKLLAQSRQPFYFTSALVIDGSRRDVVFTYILVPRAGGNS